MDNTSYVDIDEQQKRRGLYYPSSYLQCLPTIKADQNINTLVDIQNSKTPIGQIRIPQHP